MMRAAIERVGVNEYLGGADIADVDDVEKAVRELRLRCDHHSAAEVSGVRDAEIDSLNGPLFAVVHPYADIERIEVENFLERRKREICPSPDGCDRQPIENLGRFHAFYDRRRESE